MNSALFLRELRGSLKILTIFFLVLAMYTSVIIYMYNPEMGSALEDMARSIPQMMALFGMNDAGTSMISFMANYLYGFLMLVFPLVAFSMIACRLIFRHVEKGSMVYLLNAGTTRVRIAVTQAVVLLCSVLLLLVTVMAVGLLTSTVMFPGELDIGKYFQLNAGALALYLALSGLGFLASCISNDSRTYWLVGAGLPVLFYLIQMLANMGGKLENLKYATIFTLFDTKGILAQEGSAWGMAGILALAGVIFYGVGIGIFRKKDLMI